MTTRSVAARLALALLAAAPLPAPAEGAAYRWVDASGRVHYSDLPPPADARRIEEKRLPANRADGAQQPYALRKAAADFPVALYTGRDCGAPCDDARALLSRRAVPFAEKKIETEADVAAYKSRFGGEPFVPALTVGREREQGFSADGWNRMLDRAGYPAAAASRR